MYGILIIHDRLADLFSYQKYINWHYTYPDLHHLTKYMPVSLKDYITVITWVLLTGNINKYPTGKTDLAFHTVVLKV